jgi:hypothetical protein
MGLDQIDFESKIICKLGITNSTIKPPYILITRIQLLSATSWWLNWWCLTKSVDRATGARNWFAINWNLFALKLEHKFNNDADFLQLFLDASRKLLVTDLIVSQATDKKEQFVINFWRFCQLGASLLFKIRSIWES